MTLAAARSPARFSLSDVADLLAVLRAAGSRNRSTLTCHRLGFLTMAAMVVVDVIVVVVMMTMVYTNPRKRPPVSPSPPSSPRWYVLPDMSDYCVPSVVFDGAVVGVPSVSASPFLPAWPCVQQRRDVSINKRTVLGKLPPNVVLHLNRFKMNLDTFQTEKVNTRFDFPVDLDLEPFTKEVCVCVCVWLCARVCMCVRRRLSLHVYERRR